MLIVSQVAALLVVLALLVPGELGLPVLVDVCISILRRESDLVDGQEVTRPSPFLEFLDDRKFTKPVTSDKTYRFVKLENYLEVFLISQSSAKEASARMGVRVGYLKDPDSLPGLAHYLEHLLFINTKKYPELDGFAKFTTLHNGYTNAYTSDTETVYEFNTDSSSFEEALSMFSEFFKTPLFDNTYTEKELMAVENEFNFRKNYQFIRCMHVIFELSDKRSLFSRFFMGNLETLRRVPESQGIDVRDEVIKLYKREYSSNRMVLVLASNHTLDELGDLAERYFSDIENKRLPVDSIYTPIQDARLNPFNTMVKRLVLVESLEEFTTLKLIFPMKEYMAKHLSQYRSFYLDKLISSSRPGSLANHLISSKLVFDAYSKIFESNLGFTNVEIGFTLTNDGERSLANILMFLFSVIKFASLNKFPREIYDEKKKILDYNFRYGDSEPIVKESENIISNYLSYGCRPEDVLYYDNYISDFDPAIHQEIISQLTPENLVVVLEHSGLESLINNTESSRYNHFCNSTSTNEIENASYLSSNYGFETIVGSKITLGEIQTEKFIKTKYLTKSLSPCFLSLIHSVDHSLASEKCGITLPTPNPYLSRDFSDNLGDVDEEKTPVRLPGAIKKFQSRLNSTTSSLAQEALEAYDRYFYYPTKSIITPKSLVQFAFTFPLHLVTREFSEFSTSTVRVNLLFKLFLELAQLLFSKHFHEIEAASYSTTFAISTFSLDSTRTNQLAFSLFGFTDRIEEIASKVPEFMGSFTSYVTSTDFATKKEQIMTTIQTSISNPQISSNLSLMRTRLFFNQDFSFETQLSQLRNITFEEFTRFSNFFMKNSMLDGFLLGNLNPLMSAKIIEKFSSVFFSEHHPKVSAHSSSPPSSTSPSVGRVISSVRSLISLASSSIFGKRDREGQEDDSLKVKEHLRSSPPLYNVGAPDSIQSFQVLDPLSLNRGSKVYYYHLSSSTSDLNSAIKMSVAVGYNHLKNRILTNILTLIISNDFFSEIRTKKQLGYVVSAEYETMVDHVSAIRFLVVSSNKNVQTLAENTLEFFHEWLSPDSSKITQSSFEMARKSLIETLKNPIKNIPDIFSEFSSEISTRNYEFNWRGDSIAIAESLSYGQFFGWFRTIYTNSNIFMLAVQSPNSEESHVLRSLPNYLPKGFSKFTPSKPLFGHKNIRTYNQWKVFNAT